MLRADSIVDNSRRDILDKLMQHLSDGYAVAYVGEENENTVTKHFRDKGISIEEYIKKGFLTIINRDVFYSPFVPAKILLEQWNKLLTTVEKKAGKGSFKGYVAMGMPADSFFISDLDNQQLVRYESLAARQYKGGLDAVCLYTTQMLQRMPLRHLITLLNAHQNTCHRGGQLRDWNAKRALSILKRGLDFSLGPNVTELVHSTLLLDFEMNEEAMILQPNQFERKLTILLGVSAAELVIHQIKAEIIKDIVY